MVGPGETVPLPAGRGADSARPAGQAQAAVTLTLPPDHDLHVLTEQQQEAKQAGVMGQPGCGPRVICR
jgi:hypothetical protein